MNHLPPQFMGVSDHDDPATCLIRSGFNLILQMSTGSGKTYRAAAAIRESCSQGHRAIYVAPTRALANELYVRWSKEWSGLQVGIFTGDYGSEKSYPVPFSSAQVLIMTPERLDLCTRQWRHYWKWLPLVDLLVIDEVHLLCDPHRGSRLEGAIVRMRELNPFARILGLSATLGNAQQLADWLDGVCYQSTFRPIQTDWKTIVFFKADEKPTKLVEVVQPILAMGSKSLVFVQSKRRAEQLAGYLRSVGINADHHHGGLGFDQRSAVEDRFRNRKSDVLVATATLEVGLNLPVRQVVLYDLQQFDGMEFRPLSVISAWQRAGRAGRPGLDDKGEIVLFRARWEKDQQYERGQFEPIRSQASTPSNLTEQVIVLVASGFARNRSELKNLMSKTLAAKQGQICHVDRQIDSMCSAGFLSEDIAENVAPMRLKATSLGRLCSRLLISPETVMQMKHMLRVQSAWTNFDLLLLCCTLPDCDLAVTVDFEELGELGERLMTCKSHILTNDRADAAETLSVTPKRLLSAVKGALILLAWTEEENVESVAEMMSCYENEVLRLKDAALRLLSALRSVLKETINEEALLGLDREYLEKKTSRLELMIAAGLDEDASTLTLVPGIGKVWASRMVMSGILDIEMLAQSSADQLIKLGQISTKRATKWIDEATQLLSSDDMRIATDSGRSVQVQSLQIDLPFDVYRLKRSWQLQVERSSEPDTYRVSGGSDPHLVSGITGNWSCDCPDRSKGHECKHLLAVRRWVGDPVIQDIDRALTEQTEKNEINLRAWWSR